MPQTHISLYFMKPTAALAGMAALPAAAALLTASTSPLHAGNLMLDFGPTLTASPYLTTSPGHNAGTVLSTETTWNQVTTSAQVTSLNWSDGSSATGVTLTMGQGTRPSGTVTFDTAATFTGSIPGNGGSATGQEKLTTNKGTSIYGPAAGSTAATLDALFTTTFDNAIGFRIDGLSAGNYILYVMARNTNTNANTGAGMTVYASAAASDSTFSYSAISGASQSNLGKAAATYVNEYGSFMEGNNYVAVPVTVTQNQAVYVVSEGQGAANSSRGFINMIQIVKAVDSPFASWMSQYTAQIPNAADRLADADPDGDGLSNFKEYAFGSHPTNPSSRGTRLVQLTDTDGDSKNDLTLTLEVRAGSVFQQSGNVLVAQKDGISYTFEGTVDLINFDSPVSEVTPHRGTGSPAEGYEFKTFRLNASNGLTGKGFLRAKAAPIPAP